MKYNFCVRPHLVFLFLLGASYPASAQDAEAGSQLDQQLADTLKIEANHNINRIKSLKSEIQNNKVFENEREKGLGEFLEDQEKWDLVRDRGLAEFRRERRAYATPVDGGPEDREDRAKKRRLEEAFERSRETHARTRQKIESQTRYDITSLESQELGLDVKLPRYELRRRGHNKWVNSVSKSSGGSGFTPGFQSPQPTEFPPAPDFPAAPAPYEGYDESQLPPPPPVYDGSSGGVPYDPSFGGEMNIPPPPPPPPDYDF